MGPVNGSETQQTVRWSAGAEAPKVKAPPSQESGRRPDEAILFDLLADWAPDEATRTRILVDNPAALYGFG